MEVSSISDIEKAFLERVQRIVWCNVATVDTNNRPRSRILHPLWQGNVGWITTRRNSFKAKHLTHNPYVSLAYISDIAIPVYVDCKVEWVDDLNQKQLVWQLCKETPPPAGFDPEPIYERVDHPNFGVLKLAPWRIEIANFPAESLIWHG
ncbi:MAG: pyridoxamine 5'-phosphate oxidase family protein [Ktedonobacteraceae bacterium]